MAWKEHSELSGEDKRYEDVRQKMIVCQSCSERAVNIVNNVEGGEFHVVEDFVDEVIKAADKLVDWVYEKANEIDVKPVDMVLPTPTAAQKKVLDAIFESFGYDGFTWDEMCKKVLDWAEETHKIRKYPENVKSVDEFVKWNNKP